MQVKLGLFEHQGRIWLRQKTHHQNGKHLADPHANVREIMRLRQSGRHHFELVAKFSLIDRHDGFGDTQVEQPICNGRLERACRSDRLDVGRLER